MVQNRKHSKAKIFRRTKWKLQRHHGNSPNKFLNKLIRIELSNFCLFFSYHLFHGRELMLHLCPVLVQIERVIFTRLKKKSVLKFLDTFGFCNIHFNCKHQYWHKLNDDLYLCDLNLCTLETKLEAKQYLNLKNSLNYLYYGWKSAP